MTFLDGIALRFYRGIGPKTQYIAPFSQMNFFIGPNNAGKSIVLNAIADRLKSALNDHRHKNLNPEEVYRGRETGRFEILVGNSSTEICDRFLQKKCNPDQRRRLGPELQKLSYHLNENGCFWARMPKSKRLELTAKIAQAGIREEISS